MPDRAGGTVAPPSLGPGALTGPLAERTAERLRWAGVPATTSAALTGGYVLEGEARWQDGIARVAWRLSDREGVVTLIPEIRVASLKGAFEAGDDALLADLSRASAEAIAQTLQTPAAKAASREPGAVSDGKSGVHLLGVAGPNTKPAQELTRALAAILTDLGVTLVEAEEDAAVLIQGQLGIAGADVAVEWVLLAPDGSIIGTLSQNNQMAGNPGESGFGARAYDIAYPIAEAVARSLGGD
jgi:hypothetical protein